MSRQLRRTITPAVNPHKKPAVKYRRVLCFLRRAIADAVWPHTAAVAATATNRRINCGTIVTSGPFVNAGRSGDPITAGAIRGSSGSIRDQSEDELLDRQPRDDQPCRGLGPLSPVPAPLGQNRIDNGPHDRVCRRCGGGLVHGTCKQSHANTVQ